MSEKKTSITLFLSQVRQEMRKVTWPTRKESLSTLMVVLVVCVLISLYLLLADTAIAYVLKLFLGDPS